MFEQHPQAPSLIRVLQKMRGSALANAILIAVSLLAAGAPGASAKETSGEERASMVGQSLIGSLAPKLVLKTIDGQQIDLAQLYGKQAVYLKFWATWCVPCMQQMPHFERTAKTAGPGLAVIAVDVGFNDSLEHIQRVRRKFSLTMPIVMDDGTLGEALHLRVTPQHIVIGLDGRIQYVGHEANERLDAALLTAQSTQPTPRPASSIIPSIGVAQYKVGDRLPDLSATTLDGQAFRSRGDGITRPTVLVFVSPWCESYLEKSRPEASKSCRQVREQIESVAKDLDVRWLGIASGLWATPDDLSDYRTQYKVTIPLALDDSGVWFRSFRVMHVPTLLVADGGGKIVRRVDGFDAKLPAELRRIAGN
jgi:thiol-disulfide isomerase/thioredoxin